MRTRVGRREEVRAVTDHGDVIGLSSSRHQAVVLRRLACAARRCWMYAPWASTAPQNRPPSVVRGLASLSALSARRCLICCAASSGSGSVGSRHWSHRDQPNHVGSARNGGREFHCKRSSTTPAAYRTRALACGRLHRLRWDLSGNDRHRP